MGYNIPYFSDYQNWYGVPQNVSRLYAAMEQTTDDNGNFVGHITASWNVPDNGGTFILLVSTDGINYYIAKSDIKGNTAEVDVKPNTDYYVKVVTVLGSSQSEGTVSDLLSANVIPVPSSPIVTTTPGGLIIDVGMIPQGYTASIAIDNGETTDYVETSNLEYMYLCDAGNYDVSVAFVDISGSLGEYSEVVSASVKELATKEYVDDTFVKKTSHYYIKRAEVNGNSLMLTTGDDQKVIFQCGAGGFGPIVQDGDTITFPTEHMDSLIQQQVLTMHPKTKLNRMIVFLE